MILFNLMFSQNISDFPKKINLSCSRVTEFSERSTKLTQKSLALAYVVRSPDILSKPKQNIAEEKLVTRTLWQKVFNSFWQQGVFLSISDKTTDKYISELSYLSLHKNQGTHKYVISRFSKSLFNSSIQSSLVIDPSMPSGTSSDIYYVWGRKLKLKHMNASCFFQKDIVQSYATKLKTYLSQESSVSCLPLFTISNNLGQMVISELPQVSDASRAVLNNVRLGKTSHILCQGWFFINYEDAKEYMAYVSHYYGLEESKLKVFTCGLPTLYKLAGKFGYKVDFRLVPDLKEVGLLVKQYRHYSNIEFHKNQKYGGACFQGQPLYMFKALDQPLYADLPQKHLTKEYNLAFTNYNTALHAWSRLKTDSLNFKSSKKPYIVVYNLESFIKDRLNGANNNYKHRFLLVPSRSSYKFAKRQLRKNTAVFYEHFSACTSYIRLWSGRVLWSLTSRQPQGW